MLNKRIKSFIIIIVIGLLFYYIFVVKSDCFNKDNNKNFVNKKLKTYFSEDLKNITEQFVDHVENVKNEISEEELFNEEPSIDNLDSVDAHKLKDKETSFVGNEIRITNLSGNKQYLSLPDQLDLENTSENIITFKKSTVESNGSISKYIKGRFLLLEGLDGNKNTYSFKNVEYNQYLARNSNNQILSINIEPSINDLNKSNNDENNENQSNDIKKVVASFYLIDSIYDKTKCTIKCTKVGNETQHKYLMYDDKLKTLKAVGMNTMLENPKRCTFDLVDIQNDSNIFLQKELPNNNDNNYNIREGFSNHNLNPNISNFDNSSDMDSQIQNSVYYNPFSKNLGIDFYRMFNIENNIYRKELEDNLFKKLMNSKMDRNISNLLDFNQARYNIYKSENDDFAKKISTNVEKNTKNLETLIKNLNNNRIKQMSSELFLLKNKQNDNSNPEIEELI